MNSQEQYEALKAQMTQGRRVADAITNRLRVQILNDSQRDVETFALLGRAVLRRGEPGAPMDHTRFTQRGD